MEAALLELLHQLNTSVLTLFLILIIVVWGTFKLGKMSQLFTHHSTRLDKFDSLHDKLVEVRAKVDLIYQNTNPNKTVAAMSPINLTPVGKEIATKLNAHVLFARHQGKLTQLVEEAAPKTAYDVQQRSMVVAREKMMGLLNADEVSEVKAEAFNRGLLAEDIMSIFGVFLRDHVLAVKGMPVADVDKQLSR